MRFNPIMDELSLYGQDRSGLKEATICVDKIFAGIRWFFFFFVVTRSGITRTAQNEQDQGLVL